MSDIEWLQRLAGGDEVAWRRFFDEIGPLIEAIGCRMRLSAEDRDELLQSTAVRVLERIGTLRTPGSFSSWVYGIALRFAYDAHRAARRRQAIEQKASDEPESDALEPGILASLERLEQIARVQDAWAELSPQCRKLLESLYFQLTPPSYKEISERLSIPIGSIGPTRGRCLKKLLDVIPDVSGAEFRESTVGTEQED
ncbi:MAG: sigma-70 family RNA polymerase sigma factor [Candidatus Eisenbacteria bacterium]